MGALVLTRTGLILLAVGCAGCYPWVDDATHEANDCRLVHYADEDGDGYGVASSRINRCPDKVGSDYSALSGDCDDANPGRNPGLEEIPYDGIDQDCDDADLCDVDGDGLEGEGCGGLDCDDTSGAIDDQVWWYPDADGDGHGDITSAGQRCDQMKETDVSSNDDCDDTEATVNPGGIDGFGDGVDQNCDGADGVDTDGDGSANEVSGGDDCNDFEPEIYPGAPDLVDNEIDNNCDGIPGVDADNDGFADLPSGGDDCDDVDPLQNPAAVEQCTGEDDDCDGGVDTPPPPGAPTWYEDADGDSFGNLNIAFVGCDPGAGWSRDLDCDDGDPLVYPARIVDFSDVGDAIDRDCDGVDECFEDADGDSHGSQLVVPGSVGCLGVGHSLLSDDCDDSRADAYPLAPFDVSDGGDGVDADCNGSEECFEDLDLDGFGSLVLHNDGGDLDCLSPGESSSGDDCDDGLIGVNPGANEVCSNFIDDNCNGSVDGCGLFGSVTPADAEAWWTGNTGNGYSTGDLVGSAVAAGGDVTGDGIDDVVLGAPSEATQAAYAGAVFIFPINAVGGVVAADAEVTIYGTGSSDNLGSVVYAGEFTGDGVSDVMLSVYPTGQVGLFAGPLSGTYLFSDATAYISVGDTFSADGGSDLTGDGVKDLLLGNRGGNSYVVSGTGVGNIAAAASAVASLVPDLGEGTEGHEVEMGEVTGDGGVDALLSSASWFGGFGKVYVMDFPMAGSVPLSMAWAELRGESNDNAGRVVAVGDLNDDGYGDVAVNGSQKAYIVLGPVPAGNMDLVDADATWMNNSPVDVLEVVGDVDGDGKSDLLVGDPEATGGGTGDGLYLVTAAPSGVLTQAAAHFVGGEEVLGVAGGPAGDVNADGFADILVGDPYAVGYRGEAYLFLGGGF